MDFPFWKMHGAGNDFVLFDDRAGSFPVHDRVWLAALGDRRTGIGCEGFILLQRSSAADIRMRFFNPDGGEAELCGNGARCVARLAHELGAAPANMSIETRAGRLTAEVTGTEVRVQMPAPSAWRLDQSLDAGGRTLRYHAVNTGVPHVVIETTDLDAYPVHEMGQAIRRHSVFAPAGTNVNFIAVTAPDALRIRTYERGVEAESGACGTGAVAAALIAARLGRVRPPVAVATAGGYRLRIDFNLTADGAVAVALCGPTAHVFRGTIARTAGPA
jgi:diaminopimelate epimerase